MNHPHLKKNSHFACKEIIESHKKGGYPCCACNKHECIEEVEVECTCHDELEVEMVEVTGEEIGEFLEGFMKRTDPARKQMDEKCACGLHAYHSGKHAPDFGSNPVSPIKNGEPHTMEDGAKRGCPSCSDILSKLKKATVLHPERI